MRINSLQLLYDVVEHPLSVGMRNVAQDLDLAAAKHLDIPPILEFDYQHVWSATMIDAAGEMAVKIIEIDVFSQSHIAHGVDDTYRTVHGVGMKPLCDVSDLYSRSK